MTVMEAWYALSFRKKVNKYEKILEICE